jgi:hypothetical protein
LEKTLEADISKLQKTGHFYFALTQDGSNENRLDGGRVLLPPVV